MNEEQYNWTIESATNDGYFTIRSEYGYLGIENNEITIYMESVAHYTIVDKSTAGHDLPCGRCQL